MTLSTSRLLFLGAHHIKMVTSFNAGQQTNLTNYKIEEEKKYSKYTKNYNRFLGLLNTFIYIRIGIDWNTEKPK